MPNYEAVSTWRRVESIRYASASRPLGAGMATTNTS